MNRVGGTVNELEDLNGWRLSAHVRERLGDRGITVEQVRAVLARPETTVPSMKEDGCRIYTRAGVLAVVNETARTVVTVGMHGATAQDWEDHAAPLASEPFRESEAPAPVRAPHRPARKRTEPVSAVTTTRVDQRLWKECLRRANGDHRRLRIIPATGEVLILNHPA